MAQRLDKLTVSLVERGVLVQLLQDCIVLRMMLVTANSLEYYKDPEQKNALAEEVKELIKTLRQDNNLEFSDVDGIKVYISEKDVQKAEQFFNIGKYNNWVVVDICRFKPCSVPQQVREILSYAT